MSLYDDDWTAAIVAADYLKLIEGWEDPNPAPIVATHEGFVVVQDELLTTPMPSGTVDRAIYNVPVGTKVRSIDYLIGHAPWTRNIEEWVFGSCPATGYAQISLPVVCKRYGKKAVMFMADRKVENRHEYQRRGEALGTVYHWVPNGMLTVTQKRAHDYVAESPDTRELLPLGLEHPTVIASMIKIARDLEVNPTEVWTVGSSGTLNRALQIAWPNAEVHVVSVGHKMTNRDIGRAIYHRCEIPFDKPVKKEDAPPFASAPTYDAKCWKFMRELASPGALFWNVGA